MILTFILFGIKFNEIKIKNKQNNSIHLETLSMNGDTQKFIEKGAQLKSVLKNL